MEPYTPVTLPIDRIDWAAHVSQTRRILNALAEKGIVTVIQEAKGRQPSIYAFSRLIDITDRT